MTMLSTHDELTPIGDIFAEITEEQARARTKWGRDADRMANAPADWVTYIAHHATRWLPGGFRPYSRQTLLDFRSEMIKVANLAISAIQEVDLIMEGRNIRPDVFVGPPHEKPRVINEAAAWIRNADTMANSFSPDPSRKTACIIVSPITGKTISWGVNTPPEGIEMTDERLERPAKYGWLPHAERAAIASAARQGRSTEGMVAVINWFPCHPCAIDLIGAGIKTLICLEPNWEDENYSFKPAREALLEAGVEIVFAGKYAQGERK